MNTLQQAPARLGNLLVERGFLTADALDARCKNKNSSRESSCWGKLSSSRASAPKTRSLSACEEYGVPYAKLEARLCDHKIVDLLPRDYIETNLALPLFCVRDHLTVAVTEPSNVFMIEEMRALARKIFRLSPPRHEIFGG